MSDDNTEAGRRWLEQLAENVRQTRCPTCKAPWFGLRDTKCRAVCAQCGASTWKQGDQR